MRTVWTLFKIVLALAVAIPVGILALALTMGILGTLIGLAILVLKLAVVGGIGYGLYRLARLLFAPSPRRPAAPPRELPSADPYLAAAMRELDAELGQPGRSAR